MKYTTISIFTNHKNLAQAVFNRHGGRSKAPFDTLNLSFGVGDKPADVELNRSIIKEALGLDRLFSSRQVHSDRIFVVDSPLKNDKEEYGYDALITNLANVGLMIQQADCQAVMLFDPVKLVIANIHSGWKGSTLNIAGKTVQTMAAKFGTKPADVLAGISPSLGPCCAEFTNYKTELPTKLHRFQTTANHFDFWAITRDQLMREGLLRDNIETAEICTKCDHDYFSYRREGVTGRFGSVISLK